MKRRSPRVTIGVPVFDGENYLADALDSLLAQTYTDLEIIVCDNASTDRSGEIAEDYARRDPRVFYHRNQINLGPCRNFNLLVELAGGEFFKWAAHDDLIEPTFVARCVEVLDAEPDVVLVQALTRIIDDSGRELAIYDSGLQGAASEDPVDRFGSLVLTPHVCTEMFGLFRTEALRATKRLTGNYHGCDRAMLAEAALVGRFAQIAEPLFMNREHNQRYVRSVTPAERDEHHTTGEQGQISMYTWRLYRDYIRAVQDFAPSRSARMRCYARLAAWWFKNYNALRVGTELVAQVFPSFYGYAKRMKNRLVPPAHPTVDSR